MQRDSEIGKLLKLDLILLASKGFQLKAYQGKMDAHPENRVQYLREMGKIAKGNLNYDNPYVVSIFDAMGRVDDF